MIIKFENKNVNKFLIIGLVMFNFLLIASAVENIIGNEPPMYISSDESWLTTTERIDGWNTLDFDDSSWQNVNVLGIPPVRPWKEITNMEGTYAQWIGGNQENERFFRKIIPIKGEIISGSLKITADSNYTLFINGKLVGKDSGEDAWKVAEIYDIKKYLTEGNNIIAVNVSGKTLKEGLLVDATIKTSYQRKPVLDDKDINSETKKSQDVIVQKFLDYNYITLSQKVNVTIIIQNSGDSDIKEIEVVDKIIPNIEVISGNFPNHKKYDIIHPKESKKINYVIRAKDEIGEFNLDPVTITYIDDEGKKETKSSDAIFIMISSGTTPAQPQVNLYGEKTDVYMGDEIILKLSGTNLITKPKMHVQVILTPPSGMSVISSEFIESGYGVFTANFDVEPGGQKGIGITLRPNQIGDFIVKGRMIYYFGNNKEREVNYEQNLPIKVRERYTAPPQPYYTQRDIPGFTSWLSLIGILFAIYYRHR